MGMTLHTTETPEDRARALMTKKDLIEAELNTHFAILSANAVTMRTPLVDAEGFPRADLDIYAIRHARVRIIELNNDLTAIIDEIATALQSVFKSREQPAASTSASNQASAEPTPTPTNAVSVSENEELKPFARVNGVAPNSPAAVAGLRREDLILQFGELTKTAFSASSLQPLSELVAAHENRPLHVKVRRNAQEVVLLQFTPRSGWGGRGLLGCHIVPA